jgi:hypothetical protein
MQGVGRCLSVGLHQPRHLPSSTGIREGSLPSSKWRPIVTGHIPRGCIADPVNLAECTSPRRRLDVGPVCVNNHAPSTRSSRMASSASASTCRRRHAT